MLNHICDNCLLAACIIMHDIDHTDWLELWKEHTINFVCKLIQTFSMNEAQGVQAVHHGTILIFVGSLNSICLPFFSLQTPALRANISSFGALRKAYVRSQPAAASGG